SIGAAIAILAATGGSLLFARRHGAGAASADRLGAFHLGEQIRNKARLKVTLEMGAGAPPQELAGAGGWTAAVADIHDGQAEVACELSNVTSSVRVPGPGGAAQPAPPPEAEREMAAELSQRFFVSYRADGAAVGVWFPRQLNPSIAHLLLTMASA